MKTKRFLLGLAVMAAVMYAAGIVHGLLDLFIYAPVVPVIVHPRGIMGTECSLTAVPPRGQYRRAEQALAAAEQALRAVEAHMSVYIRFSELSQLNDAPAGKAMTLSPDTMAVLRLSRQFNEQTGGAFDVTCLPLFNLWADAGKANLLPTDAMLAATKAKCGWDKWKLLDAGAVKSVDGAGIGLGGVAKGWAADRAAEAIVAAGCPGGLVEVGGDIRCFGSPAHKGKWVVAVQNPFNSGGGEFFGTLALGNAGVCTSGNYQRFSVINGRHYSHIIDPRSGEPVDFAPSVTVVGPNAAIADGWATALSVLGPGGFKLLDANSGIEAMIVVGGPKDYRIHETPGFARLLDKPIPRSQAQTTAPTSSSRDAGDLPAGRQVQGKRESK
jgi:thiamine biosynthesis lipoprotein